MGGWVEAGTTGTAFGAAASAEEDGVFAASAEDAASDADGKVEAGAAMCRCSHAPPAEASP